jgi:hypothetical protein
LNEVWNMITRRARGLAQPRDRCQIWLWWLQHTGLLMGEPARPPLSLPATAASPRRGLHVISAQVRQQIERARDTGYSLPRDVRVDHRCLQTLVSQQELHGADVRAGFDEMRGFAMKQD